MSHPAGCTCSMCWIGERGAFAGSVTQPIDLGELMRVEDHRAKLKQYRLAYWIFFAGLLFYAAITQNTIRGYRRAAGANLTTIRGYSLALDARDRALAQPCSSRAEGK